MTPRFIKLIEPDIHGNKKGLFECSCGKRFPALCYQVKNCNTRSCGCYRLKRLRQANITHNQTGSRTYVSYREMWTRCTNSNRKQWKDYGGRGIRVCPQWYTFENFLRDMGERPQGKTLDRIDVDGNYGPNNCKWSTWSEQMYNKRKRKYCERGHFFSKANTVQNKQSRCCRICKNAMYRKRYAEGKIYQKVDRR